MWVYWIVMAENSCPKVEEVEDFIARFQDVYGPALSNLHNYSRVVSMAWLEKFLRENSLNMQEHVGVISGNEQELELRFLQYQKLTTTNIDTGFNLDDDLTKKEAFGCNFILLNQVLEHVFNPRQVFRNIKHHLADGGYFYISIPTINCIHGDPFFYSSGFHPRYLERMAKEFNFDVIGLGYWGSPKYMVHAVSGRKWLSHDDLLPGLHGEHDVMFPNFIAVDGRHQVDLVSKSMGFPETITDCWVLLRKK